jgi:hypothetical protein
MKTKKLTYTFTFFLAILLSGCAADYAVVGHFPAPLVDPLPVSAGLVLSDDFQNYRFAENEDDRNKLTLALGAAQSELFRVVAGQMFQSLTVNEPFEGVDLLIHPEVETFQYAFPRETRANIYEVWIKYRVQVTDPSGNTIADWLINGYGKTPTAFLKSEGDALQAAVTLALRDVGVQLAIGFPRQEAVVAWLETHNGDAI